MIAIGKMARLSMQEINEFRVQDLLDFDDIISGKSDDEPRKATQVDIDKFYAN